MTQKQLPSSVVSVTKPLPGRMGACPCPNCKTPDLVWKTKDAQSQPLGQVHCPACGFTQEKKDFLASTWSDYKKAFK